MNAKKVMTVLTAAAVIAGSFIGCGSNDGSGDNVAKDAEQGKEKIVFAYWGAESENAAIQKAVDDFRANNNDIEVETQWIEKDYLTKLQTQIAGDTMADVYLISSGDIPGFADNFEEETVDSSKYLSDNIIESMTVDGKVKARPFIVKPKVMAINKDLFQEAGIAIPENGTPMTIEEYETALESLSDASKDPQQFGSESPWITNLIYAFDGSYYKEDGTKSNLGCQEDIDAANFIINARENGWVPDSVQSQGQNMLEWFLSERIAMYTDFGPWYIPQMDEVEGFDWDLVTYPGNGGCKEVDGLAISAKSENKEAAEKFVTWMCESDSAQKAIGGDSSAYGVPVNPNAVDSFLTIYPDKNMQAYVDAAYNQRVQETQKRTNEINSVTNRINDDTAVGTGDGDPAEVFPEVAKEVDQILAD